MYECVSVCAVKSMLVCVCMICCISIARVFYILYYTGIIF